MNHTEILYLVNQVQHQDNIGNIYYTEELEKTYAKKRYLGTREFYNAVAVGITPSVEMSVWANNYAGQKEVEYQGIRMTVIRAMEVSHNEIVLVLANKEGNNYA